MASYNKQNRNQEWNGTEWVTTVPRVRTEIMSLSKLGSSSSNSDDEDFEGLFSCVMQKGEKTVVIFWWWP